MAAFEKPDHDIDFSLPLMIPRLFRFDPCVPALICGGRLAMMMTMPGLPL
jgi:hypothetical protein